MSRFSPGAVVENVDVLGEGDDFGIHGAILGSIPPDLLMRSLALMLPAMNVDDRTELLAGMRAAAPPKAFAAPCSASPSPYCPADLAATTARIA